MIERERNDDEMSKKSRHHQKTMMAGGRPPGSVTESPPPPPSSRRERRTKELELELERQRQTKRPRHEVAAEEQQRPPTPTKTHLKQQEEANVCAACQKPIRERYLLMALDKRWHEDCLKCACCDCRLGEVGSSLFTHSDKLLCRRDFLRIFGQQGHCAACRRPIPPYELVMRAQEKAYHLDCFACQRCQYRFCVGDRFQLTETHKIICLLCHGEQQQQQSARVSPPSVQPAPTDSENEPHEPRTTAPALDLFELESVASQQNKRDVTAAVRKQPEAMQQAEHVCIV